MSRLEISSLPVLAAPMAGGPSTPRLVAAVAGAQTVGFLPAGYRTAEQFAADLQETRRQTADFGVNLFVPERQPIDRGAVLAYRDLIAPAAQRVAAQLGTPRWDDDDDWPAKVDLLARDPVPWASFTFGLPDAGSVSRLRRAGTRLLITVTSAEEARLAAELRPDGLIVQSAAAGGHRATFDQRRIPDATPLPALLRAVRAATALPLLAAGGIASPAQVAEVLTAGAEAALVGTALLLADEAGTRPVHRRALVDPSARTAPMRAFTGRIARGIRNAFSDRYDPAAPAGYPAIHHVTAPLRRWAAENEDPAYLHLWAGTGHRSAAPGAAAELLRSLAP
jgi:NAD(P)H-dependent flavin oxidoreductase YrpB (nitropropane dioxygenase family)